MLMGKITEGVNNAAIRTGNTIATPLRRWGELANAIWNISRQWFSSIKNIKEVQIQTINAMADNFLNFSKVKWKWYQKMLKVPVNFVSAVTRRPMMIWGAEVLSTLNQWVRQPFKKLLYTPGKMFKGMRNATRIFSKKKWFDFTQYDTHETTWDTRVNKIKEWGIGFLGVNPWSAAKDKAAEKKEETPSTPIEAKKEEKPKPAPVEVKKPDTESKPEKTPPKTPPTPDKPKSIDDLKKQYKEEGVQKEKKEQDEKFPQWKTLDPKFKVAYRKDYDKTLKNNPTKEWIVARGKEAKLWEKPEEIIGNFKKIDPTFAGYMEEEILDKAA